jgi:hypothetical protein
MVEQDRGTRMLDLQLDGGHRGPSFEAENLNHRVGVVNRINNRGNQNGMDVLETRSLCRYKG